MSESLKSPNSFFQELRNRRVFRVATVYIGIAFALIEVSDILFPMMAAPDWSLKALVYLLLLGFPSALTLAWMFQFTPEGLRRSPRTGEKQSSKEKPFTGNAIIIVLLALLLGFQLYPNLIVGSGTSTQERQAEQLDEKSVAVLPFTNFSSSEEDAYFADGIHDDILTQLSKINDLRVISRTTMMKYRNSEKSILEIAREIGSANVLEGSVRRAGDQVRIVAQLINARTDEHLWADTYDRAYADIFSIQTDVAKKIAGALKSALSPEEQAELEAIPTQNMKAYDYFLKGNYYWHTKTTKEGNMKAVAMYEEAIKLDPNFGLAYARQSIGHSVLFMAANWDPTPERKALAKQTLDRAIELIPDHPETHFAHGIYYIWCLKDRDAAIKELELAAEGQPNNGEIANHLGQLYFESGKWDKAGSYLNKAFELDPDVIGHAAWVAGYYTFLRDYDKAEEFYRSAIRSFPENDLAYRLHARLKVKAHGDLRGAQQVLNDGILNVDQPERLTPPSFWLALDMRDFDTALKLAEEEYEGTTPDLYRGIALFHLGREAEMRAKLEQSVRNLTDRIKEQPENAYLHDRLGLAYALLGKKEKAISAGKAAIELESLSKNAINGPDHLENLAMIYALLGEGEHALDIIEDLLGFPNDLSLWKLKLNPAYDNLRELPRYQKLVKGVA